MRFTPKTEKELSEMGILPDGIYPYEVVDAVDTTSAAGNDMIELSLVIFAPDGGTRKASDYLLEKLVFKLNHFCKQNDLLGAYANGSLCADDCIGKSGYLLLSMEKGKEKADKPGQFWPNKNTVKDYVPPPARSGALAEPETRHTPPPAAAKAAPVAAGNIDEDVPF